MHEIQLEKVLSRSKTAAYPLCLDGERACPPEDCGGVPGYANLLEVLIDPKHTEYEETREWVGEGFDPDHFDEFFNAFEFGDLTHDHEYDPENEVNPFLHIMIHAAIENQLSGKDPLEVYQFYNAMRQKKVSHHETLHLLGAILMPLVFDCLRQKRPFDNEAYRLQLKKYKSKNPKKIGELPSKEDPS